MSSLLFPQLIKYALTSRVFILTVPSAWNPLLRDVHIHYSRDVHILLLPSGLSAQKSPYQRNPPCQHYVRQLIYISPFSISLFCVVFLSNIYQLFIICPLTPIFQKVSSMPSGPLLIMSSLPIIVPGTQYYNRL